MGLLVLNALLFTFYFQSMVARLPGHMNKNNVVAFSGRAKAFTAAFLFVSVGCFLLTKALGHKSLAYVFIAFVTVKIFYLYLKSAQQVRFILLGFIKYERQMQDVDHDDTRSKFIKRLTQGFHKSNAFIQRVGILAFGVTVLSAYTAVVVPLSKNKQAETEHGWRMFHFLHNFVSQFLYRVLLAWSMIWFFEYINFALHNIEAAKSLKFKRGRQVEPTTQPKSTPLSGKT